MECECFWGLRHKIIYLKPMSHSSSGIHRSESCMKRCGCFITCILLNRCRVHWLSSIFKHNPMRVCRAMNSPLTHIHTHLQLCCWAPGWEGASLASLGGPVWPHSSLYYQNYITSNFIMYYCICLLFHTSNPNKLIDTELFALYRWPYTLPEFTQVGEQTCLCVVFTFFIWVLI